MKFSNVKSYIAICLVLALAIVSGCQKDNTPINNEDLYNSSLNQELDNLTAPGAKPEFQEFYLNFTPRQEADYEFAGQDVLAVGGENFAADKAAVLGIMLGDNYSHVLEKLGVPDLMFVPADRSYKNMEYGKKIGVAGVVTAVTYHLENDTVTQISMRKPFAKYLVGNTSIGQEKERLYETLGVTDYQDFSTAHKVYHYVSKGIDFYLNRDKVEIITIYEPKEFKGVKYVTVMEEFAPGIFNNVTKAVLIE